MTDVVSKIQRTLDGLRRAHHRAVRIGSIQLSAGDYGAVKAAHGTAATYMHTGDVLPINEDPTVQDGEVWVTVSFR